MPRAHASVDPGRVDERPELQVGRGVHLDGDFLQDDRWPLAAAERQYLDDRGRAVGTEPEARRQLAIREVVALVDEISLLGGGTQADAIQDDVAGDRVRGLRGRLD